MCFRTNCKECGKYTWAGCGKHIEQALAGLKDDEICKCKKQEKTETK